MRIISGTAANRLLKAPKGLDVRPTPDLVRQAVFNSLGDRVLDARVLEAMMPWWSARCGNASSRHEYGRQARAAIDAAREQVAAAVGASPSEIIFTSGGSEANNLFIKGAALSIKPGLIGVGGLCGAVHAARAVHRIERHHCRSATGAVPSARAGCLCRAAATGFRGGAV